MRISDWSSDVCSSDLLHPALAGISGSEHDTVVSDCPAVRCIAEADRRQVAANRHTGLLPGVGLVIGVKDVSALADRDQTLAGARQSVDQAMLGKPPGDRRRIQWVGELRAREGSPDKPHASEQPGHPQAGARKSTA